MSVGKRFGKVFVGKRLSKAFGNDIHIHWYLLDPCDLSKCNSMSAINKKELPIFINGNLDLIQVFFLFFVAFGFYLVENVIPLLESVVVELLKAFAFVLSAIDFLVPSFVQS